MITIEEDTLDISAMTTGNRNETFTIRRHGPRLNTIR